MRHISSSTIVSVLTLAAISIAAPAEENLQGSKALAISVETVAPAVTTVHTSTTKPDIGTIPESILDATALGVDVYGPIPNDAVWVELGDGIGYWSAEPGTKASAWIRAQIDLNEYEENLEAAGEVLEKREYANIGIGLWAQDNCEFTI